MRDRPLLVAVSLALVVAAGGAGRNGEQASSASASPYLDAVLVDAPVRLVPLLRQAVHTCRRAQVATRLPVLCPARLPQAIMAVVRGGGTGPPRLRAEIDGSITHPAATGSGLVFGVEFSYGSPVEPTSSPPGRPNWWRTHLTWNRPCCFLHFTIWRLPSDLALPSGTHPDTVAGQRGRLRPASSHGLATDRNYWWANHVWFFWQQDGARYAASLHSFGPATRPLLARLLQELEPASGLPSHR